MRLVIAFPPGGPADIVGRAVAQKLGESLGQSIVIDNRPGGNANIGAEAAARSSPDGYTLFLATSTHATNVSLYRSLRYDLQRDFAPVARLAVFPLVLVAHPSLKVVTTRELIALAKAKPGQLNFASAGNGTSQHLSGELFKVMAGVDMVHVPYKGTAPAMVDLIAGQVQLSFDNVTTLVPHIQGGKLRALAVTPAKRTPILPDVPTVAEAGVPGYEASVWFGVFAPAGTPAPVIAKLHEEIGKALNTPDLRGRFNAMGTDVSGMGPAEFQAFVRKEVPKWAEVVKKANVKIN